MPTWRGQRSKYGNLPCVDASGRRYASIGERNRGTVLKMLQANLQISDLEFQKRMPIVVNGVKICDYIADFVYNESCKVVVEDYKGFETPEFKLKWKLLKVLYPQYEFRLVFKNGRKK